MAVAATKRPDKWDAETRAQFVRFDDPKSQSWGCIPERTDRDPRSPIRSPSRGRQDNSYLATANGNELKNTLGDLCKRVTSDREHSCREECEKIGRSQRQESYRLTRKECTKRDATGCVAEDFFKPEYHDCAGGHRLGKTNTAGGLCNNRDNDSLGGHFFRKVDHINLPEEELSRRSNYRSPLPLTPFGDLRKALIDAGGSPKSVSHSSSRSRSTARGSNVDCPQLSHSRSVSVSSSRCVTPRRLGRHESRAIPFRQKSFQHYASILEYPAPEEGFKCHARNGTIFSPGYAPSKSKPAKSHCSLVPNNSAASSQRSPHGIKVPGPRRISLLERYQRGLMLRKPSIRSKGSSSTRRKTRCCESLSEEARPASEAKASSFMRHDGYWRGKLEEGLSPLRSPWREVPKAIPYEDPRDFHPCCEQWPADNFRRKHCRNPENYHPSDTRRESQHSASPLIHSFKCYDSPVNYGNNSQTTRASGNYSSPQTTRDTTNLSHAPKLRSFYDENVYVARHPCSYDDPQTTEDSYTCTRCLAAEGLSSVKDDPHPAKGFSSENENSQTPKDSFSRPRLAAKGSSSSNNPHLGTNFPWQNENPQTRKDSLRCARPPLAAKDITSANNDTSRISSWPNENSQIGKDSFRCARPRLGEESLSACNDPQSRKNLSGQKVNPQTAQDSFGYTRPHLGAKDLSSTNDDPHDSRKFLSQNELEESRDREAQFDNRHDARTSWRQNDLYQAKEVFHPVSVREVFDDPVSTRDSCWYNDPETGDEERKAAQRSWRRTHPANAEMEVSSSFKASHRDSWRPDLGRATASRFDETERHSRRQAGPQESKELASPFAEPNVERDSWQSSDSGAGRYMPTKNGFPYLKPRTNFCHDNTPRIRTPCCRSADDNLSLPLSSRHYCEPQSQSHKTDVPVRAASRYPPSVQRCETRHYDDDNFASSSRQREKKRTNGIRSP